ncbi:MAG TPA: SUMF1/EgtB/PvdO family nonheme iron enzyme [Blastocatellia bacterium]|nr:SUMF1/EgtB/PvdO family nonheme iron enzyme [Blastocatellia bacterium]
MIWRVRRKRRSGRASVNPRHKSFNKQQLVSISITVLIGVILTVMAAFLPFYFFAKAPATANREIEQPGKAAPSIMRPSALTPEAAVRAPAGELPVAGGIVALKREGEPVQQVPVEAFAIAETEVTNSQYQEFVRETKRAAPSHWRDREYPPGTATEPVTMVTWQDAVDYCAWLSRKLGALVRLPTEAEWELAAGGTSSFQYPWGNEWNDAAATCAERGGQVHAVKSYPAGRSPVGAYEMAGNVWEWVADEAFDREGQPLMKSGAFLKIAKGGAADESKSFIGTRARAVLQADQPRQYLGFRYVVIRKRPNLRSDSVARHVPDRGI